MSTGAVLEDWERKIREMRKASGVENWTRHDLRRTSASVLTLMGDDSHVVTGALNQASINSRRPPKRVEHPQLSRIANALQSLAGRPESILPS
jgi:hypothetical protein